MSAYSYYNEFEPFAAEWLRRLISRNLIAPGDVDERSITEVHPDDLRGYTQCHFFAGVGGWSRALRLAGWPDDRPVWTGSCPCQPFSAAGRQKGFDDHRHLWPDFHRLIRECRPPAVFGEQVAGAAGLAWLDHVCFDLEESGYSVAAADLPACSVGAPHRRQRLWWVAHHEAGRWGEVDTIIRRCDERGDSQGCERLEHRSDDGIVGNADHAGLEGRSDYSGEHAGQQSAGPSSPWRDLEWLPCSDGKARPTQPGLFPLAHGIPGRVGRLRAYGNAIVPRVAAEFIRSFVDAEGDAVPRLGFLD